ncbi:glycosyltransferase [Streptomyces sp. NPDC088789]|uniref:glycosyltransferase n=1 Tax=Streptomyces sp. NPDC088789 TaxID=3365899 RepID=UPI0038156492
MDLTFAIPMYNEEEVAGETVTRVLKAGVDSGRRFEVLAVDDGSTDGTARVLAELAATHEHFRWVQLRPNCGQPAASKAGMLAARGRMVAVLDADLQTPPELVPRLADRLEQAGPETVAVFGTTSTAHRDDPARLMAGQAVFYFLQTRLSRSPIPHGASSFFVMRADTARHVAGLRFTKGNVGAVLAALGLSMESVGYEKPASYREESRLGLRGHVEEGLGSLALTGALTRCAAATVAAGLGAVALTRRGPLARGGLATAGLGLLGLGAAEGFARRSLTDSPAPLPVHPGEPGAGGGPV